MSVQFFTEYPLWFILFCLAAGGLYSFILYRRNASSAMAFGRVVLWVITGLRFLSVSLIAFLLLNPLLKYVSTEVEKPVVVVAIDNSMSVTGHPDSALMRKELPAFYSEFQKAAGDNIKVQTYRFGSVPKVSDSLNFREKQTDISGLIDELNTVYSGSNVAGVVLLSDGIYNKGIQPAYAAANTRFPIFTVGLGDTTLKKDLRITSVRMNSIAYLNNRFPAVVEFQADKCRGIPFKLTIYRGETILYESVFTPDSPSDFETVQLDLEASKPGILQYSAVLSNLNGEVTWANNRKDFFIEVIDARQKVLILGKSPHPDISALKQALESNMNYEVAVDVSGTFPKEKLTGADVLVLHQMPSSPAHVPLIREQMARHIPMLFVFGRQTQMGLFNQLNTGMSYAQTGGGYNQATGVVHQDFNLFENRDEVKSSISYFPPLSVPFGTFGVKDAGQILLYQQIGNLKTDQPLICFSEDADNRYGYLTGEGFWRWRLIDYERNRQHDVTNGLAGKIVQYLVARNDKRRFRVTPAETAFLENERIQFNAEYYNQSYELINKPEVSLVLTNNKGVNYPFHFSRTANAYRLNAGILPPGTYTWLARVVSGGKGETASGVIVVKPLQVESTDMRANHEVLKQLSDKTGGKFFEFKDRAKIAEFIKKQSTTRPVQYESKSFNDLINQKWVFFLILALISAEWFLRKRHGAY